MRKVVSGLFVVVMSIMAANVKAEGDRYFLLGYTSSDAQATTSYGAFTKFDTATSLTLGFSTALYEDYNIGLIADVNEDIQELDDFVFLFGTKNSRFRVKNNHVTGKRNNVPFDYKESSYLWYTKPENSWGESWGLIYGNYTTLGQHDTYTPPSGSDFIPVEVSYFGYMKVGERIDTNKKGWGAEGLFGFVFMQYKADASTGLSDATGLGLYFDARYGYFARFPGIQSGSKSVLFAGINQNMLMDFTEEYSLPWMLGPAVQFTTKW